MFEKKTTTEAGVDSVDQGSGAIVVRMYSGKLVPRKHEDKDRTIDLDTGNANIGEKEAMKAGKSIKVPRDGDVMTKNYKAAHSKMRAPKEGSFCIILREKFWLQSRRIIQADGAPWAASKTEADTSSVQAKNGEMNSADGPPVKKAKRENGQQLKTEDCIDLT